MMVSDPTTNGNLHVAGGYGPPGGGYPPPGGGGGYGGPPPGGGGYGGPPGGGGGGYGGPPPGGGGFGGPPGGGPPGGGGFGGPPPGGAPPPGGYGQPPGFGPPGGFPPPGGPMMPGAGGDVNTTLPLVLSIVELVLCCNVLFGVLGLVFSIQAGNAKKAGDLETARSKAKLAIIMVIVGAVLEGLGILANVLASAMH